MASVYGYNTRTSSEIQTESQGAEFMIFNEFMTKEERLAVIERYDPQQFCGAEDEILNFITLESKEEVEAMIRKNIFKPRYLLGANYPSFLRERKNFFNAIDPSNHNIIEFNFAEEKVVLCRDGSVDRYRLVDKTVEQESREDSFRSIDYQAYRDEQEFLGSKVMDVSIPHAVEGDDIPCVYSNKTLVPKQFLNIENEINVVGPYCQVSMAVPGRNPVVIKFDLAHVKAKLRHYPAKKLEDQASVFYYRLFHSPAVFVTASLTTQFNFLEKLNRKGIPQSLWLPLLRSWIVSLGSHQERVKNSLLKLYAHYVENKRRERRYRQKNPRNSPKMNGTAQSQMFKVCRAVNKVVDLCDSADKVTEVVDKVEQISSNIDADKVKNLTDLLTSDAFLQDIQDTSSLIGKTSKIINGFFSNKIVSAVTGGLATVASLGSMVIDCINTLMDSVIDKFSLDKDSIIVRCMIGFFFSCIVVCVCGQLMNLPSIFKQALSSVAVTLFGRHYTFDTEEVQLQSGSRMLYTIVAMMAFLLTGAKLSDGWLPRSATTWATLFEDFLGVAKELINVCAVKMGGEPWFPDDPMMAKYLTFLTELNDFVHTPEIDRLVVREEEYAIRAIDLQRESMPFRKVIQESRYSKNYCPTFVSANLTLLDDLATRAMSSSCLVSGRMVPIVFYLYGLPEQGKTEVMNILPQAMHHILSTYPELSHLFGKDFNPRDVYPRAQDSEYWEGYTGQTFMTLNEIFCMNKVEDRCVVAQDVLKCVDSSPYSLNMAFKGKGSTYFMSRVIIATSNSDKIQNLGLVSHAAFARRLDFPLKVTRKAMIDKADPDLDGAWEFEVIDFGEPKALSSKFAQLNVKVGTKLNFSDLVTKACELFLRRFKKEDSVSAIKYDWSKILKPKVAKGQGFFDRLQNWILPQLDLADVVAEDPDPLYSMFSEEGTFTDKIKNFFGIPSEGVRCLMLAPPPKLELRDSDPLFTNGFVFFLEMVRFRKDWASLFSTWGFNYEELYGYYLYFNSVLLNGDKRSSFLMGPSTSDAILFGPRRYTWGALMKKLVDVDVAPCVPSLAEIYTNATAIAPIAEARRLGSKNLISYYVPSLQIRFSLRKEDLSNKDNFLVVDCCERALSSYLVNCIHYYSAKFAFVDVQWKVVITERESLDFLVIRNMEHKPVVTAGTKSVVLNWGSTAVLWILLGTLVTLGYGVFSAFRNISYSLFPASQKSTRLEDGSFDLQSWQKRNVDRLVDKGNAFDYRRMAQSQSFVETEIRNYESIVESNVRLVEINFEDGTVGVSHITFASPTFGFMASHAISLAPFKNIGIYSSKGDSCKYYNPLDFELKVEKKRDQATLAFPMPVNGVKNICNRLRTSVCTYAQNCVRLWKAAVENDVKVLYTDTDHLEYCKVPLPSMTSEGKILLEDYYVIRNGGGFQGACGNIVCSRDKKDYNTPILGIHIAQIGLDSIVSPIVLDDVPAKHRGVQSVVTPMNHIFSEAQSMPIQGAATFPKPVKRINMPVASCLIKSPISQYLPRDTDLVEPARLSSFVGQNGEVVNPLKMAHAKVGQVLPSSFHPFVNRAVKRQAMKLFEGFEPSMPYKWKCYTMEEVIFGIPGEVDSLYGSASPGPGFKTPQSSKRNDYFDKDTRWISPILRSEVERRLELLKQGHPLNGLVSDCLKDELHKKDKARSGKARLFCVGDFAACIIYKMYFGHYINFIKNHRTGGSCSIGSNPHDFNWTMLYRRIFKFGRKRVIGGDFPAFDMSTSSVMSYYFYKYVKWKLQIPPEMKQIFKLLCYGITNTVHICGDWSYVMDHGNSSGNYLTAWFNSFVAHFYYACAYYYTVDPQFTTTMSDYVGHAVYGDDGLASVSEEVDFDNLALARGVKELFGLVVTDTAKKPIEKPWLLPEEQTFLSRSFVQTELGVLAPLNEDSLWGMLHWVRHHSHLSDMEQLLQNVDAFSGELSHYSPGEAKDKWEQVKDALYRASIPYVGKSPKEWRRIRNEQSTQTVSLYY